MKELLDKLYSLSNVYEDFIYGTVDYAKEKPEHLKVLLDYLRNNDNLTTSDVVYFIMIQPDFFDDSAELSVTEKVS
ncbi:MAG TPA: hypothetical protein DCP07_05390 [Lachnospiraceae bacterium]|nr:hypothetical protein [Lachnospiraceae bacterium]